MVDLDDEVRCYNSPSQLWTVVATDVDRDVDVEAARVWRLPNGNTLIRRGNTAMVVPEKDLKPRSDEVV